MEKPQALAATAGGLAIYAALCPFAGLLSDRIGRKPSMVLGSAGLALFAIPAFVIMSSGSVLGVVLAIAGFAIFEAMVNVTTVVLLVELFPARTRMSGGSIGFNLGARRHRRPRAADRGGAGVRRSRSPAPARSTWSPSRSSRCSRWRGCLPETRGDRPRA